MTDKDRKMNISKNIYASRMKATASRTCPGKSAEADVKVIREAIDSF